MINLKFVICDTSLNKECKEITGDSLLGEKKTQFSTVLFQVSETG